MIRKYLQVISTGLQSTFVYRFNFLVRCLFGFVPLSATILLWKAVYEGNSLTGDIKGYTLSGMISYYLLITLVDAMTAVNEDDWETAADIREGRINHFLLKPIDYMAYRLCIYGAGRIIYLLVSGIPILILTALLHRYFLWPESVYHFLLFVVSLILSGLLQFFFSFSMALLSFWVLEVSTLIFLIYAFEYVAGGHLFPIDILPASITTLLFYTPFPYLLFFPVSIYLGKEMTVSLSQGLLIQFGWVLFFFLLARFIWARGIRKYSAFGG